MKSLFGFISLPAAVIALLSLPCAVVHAGTSVALQADRDSVIATGVSSAFVANNYGGAGATAVAGSATAKAEQRTITRFDTASAKAGFDTAYGVGAWRVGSVTLQFNCQVPGGANPVFNNPNVAGSFRIDWIPADNWIEGSGTPNAPASAGVTWNDLSALLTGAEGQGSRSFSGAAGIASYTLTPSTGLVNDILAGGKSSFILSAVDSTMTMVLNAHTYVTVENRPVLTITAVPLPAVTAAATNLARTGATLNGLATGAGAALTLSFDYGETGSYGSTIAATPSSVGGSASTNVSAAVTGLTPLTSYHFRLHAEDGVNTYLGKDFTFTTLGGPEIAVEQPAGTSLTDGASSLAFGSVLVGQTASRTFTVRNSGGDDLVIVSISVDNQTTGAGFTAGTAVQTTLATNQSTTFTVQFAPTTAGSKSAQLHILSNDPDEATFDIGLGGSAQNNAPTISDVKDHGISPNTSTGAIEFTVDDVESGAGGVNVSGSSSNTVLVPNANIVVGGSGVNRTVTITPAAGQSGLTTISLTASDDTDSATDTFVLDVSIDTTAPTVKVTSPAVNAVFNEGAVVKLEGSAADNKALSKLQVQVNGSPPSDVPLAGTSATFSVPLTPVPGTNTLTVKSVDLRGTASASTTRSFTYVVNRPLTMNVTGNGSVSAPFPGPYPQQVSLTLAKSYTITATPKPGQVFNGWTVTNGANTGITAAAQELPKLTFTMQPGLELTASFIANPFTAVAGSYNGLVHANPTQPAPGVTVPGVSTEGLFTASLTGTGSFTGSLLIDGAALPVSGVFDNAGTARFGTARATSVSVPRTGRSPLLVTLHLDLGGTDRITGSATQSQRNAVMAVSDITADRAFYNGTTARVPDDYLTGTGATAADGRFTVILPPKGLASQPAGFTLRDYPQGHGYGSLTITKAGKVTLSGTLADNTPVVITSSLSKNNDCPLFVQLYSKLGFFSAQLVLNKNDADSDVSAVNALWSRPYISGQWYPYGWPEVIKTDLYGAKYAMMANVSVLPALPNTTLTTTANASLTFSSGALPGALAKDVNISKTDSVTNVPKTDTSFSLLITRTTGLISGSFISVSGSNVTTKPAFRGTVYQKGAHAGGHGFFMTVKPAVTDFTGESGDVLLLAKPTGP